VEIRVLNVEVSHVLVRHEDSLGIGFVVEFASNRQAGSGDRGADQFDDDAIAEQRFGPPILGNEREQAMLGLCSIWWFPAADYIAATRSTRGLSKTKTKPSVLMQVAHSR
jgi:hypothetical protein